VLAIQVGEKTSQNYMLEARNPGGHSSMPRPDNAIYQLSAAVDRIAAYKFPVQLTDTTRAFFTKRAAIATGPMAAAMRAVVADPGDAAAAALLSVDPTLNSTLRTTCVVTLFDAGHAQNALPQRATANVNCRIFPGDTLESTAAALNKVIADSGVVLTAQAQRGPLAVPPPLDPKVVGPAETLAAKLFPGVPVLPIMSTGATDAGFLAAVGIPTYGVPGILYEADGGGIHGLNERIRVASVYRGRDYLHALIRIYAEAK